MKAFAGARLLHDDGRRRCTGTRVRNITSFACTRQTGTISDENEKLRKQNGLLYDIIKTVTIYYCKSCVGVALFLYVPSFATRQSCTAWSEECHQSVGR